MHSQHKELEPAAKGIGDALTKAQRGASAKQAETLSSCVALLAQKLAVAREAVRQAAAWDSIQCAHLTGCAGCRCV